MTPAAPSYFDLTKEDLIAIVQIRDARIEELEYRDFRHCRTIAEYAEIIWGKKSEKHIRTLAQADLDTLQPELPLQDVPEIETKVIEITKVSGRQTDASPQGPAVRYQRSVKPAGRKKLSETLPREYMEILPAGYHSEMVRIDEEVTEELDYRPGSFFVRVISRPRFADPHTKGVAIAPMPQRPIHKGIAAAGLLAWILVSRFCDHLPYYRQVKMLNRYGETIVGTSTMGRWVKESINLLTMIYSRMKEKVLACDYLMADETTIKVLDPQKDTGKHNGFIWGYLAPIINLVVMDYAEGRAADYPEDFIGEFEGVLLTDAYAGYSKLIEDKEHIKHTCCWIHCRRNYFKAISSDKKRGTEALDMIAELYAVESAARKKGANPQEHLKMRQELSLPVLNRIKDWAKEQLTQLNKKSAIAEACRYMLKRWDKLIYFTTDARLHLDTNLLEGRYRGIALGRKNWLFAGNHQSAERTAIIYSIVESCALNKVDPYSYLKDVLTRLPYLTFGPKEKLDDLLPNNWKPQIETVYLSEQKTNLQKTG